MVYVDAGMILKCWQTFDRNNNGNNVDDTMDTTAGAKAGVKAGVKADTTADRLADITVRIIKLETIMQKT